MRNAVAGPTTIAQVHENVSKFIPIDIFGRLNRASIQAAKKESYQHQISMSRGGSRHGDRGEISQLVGPDGWTVAGSGSGPAHPPPKAADLSNFRNISKT